MTDKDTRFGAGLLEVIADVGGWKRIDTESAILGRNIREPPSGAGFSFDFEPIV